MAGAGPTWGQSHPGTKIFHIRVSEIHILYGNLGKGGWGRLEEFWMEIGKVWGRVTNFVCELKVSYFGWKLEKFMGDSIVF